MVKVEVIKEGWGGLEKGYTLDMHKSTASALVAHKVVKIVGEETEEEKPEKADKPNVIKSDKDKK